MRHHLALLEEAGRPDAAARRQFGNVTSLKEESRSMWTFAFLEQFAQDLDMRCARWQPPALHRHRRAVARPRHRRQHRHLQFHGRDPAARPAGEPSRATRDRGMACAAALGGRERYQRHAHGYGKGGTASPNFPYAAYTALRAEKILLRPVCLHLCAKLQCDCGRSRPNRSAADSSPGNYFSRLGVPPAAGRLFADYDDRAGAAATVVLAVLLLAAALQRRPSGSRQIGPDR